MKLLKVHLNQRDCYVVPEDFCAGISWFISSENTLIPLPICAAVLSSAANTHHSHTHTTVTHTMKIPTIGAMLLLLAAILCAMVDGYCPTSCLESETNKICPKAGGATSVVCSDSGDGASVSVQCECGDLGVQSSLSGYGVTCGGNNNQERTSCSSGGGTTSTANDAAPLTTTLSRTVAVVFATCSIVVML